MMRSMDWGRLRDQCLVGLAAIAFLWVGSQVVGRVLQIVVVVLLALVLAYALELPLSWAEKLLPRAPAALLIYALTLGLLACGVLLIGPPLIQQSEALANRLPAYLDQLNGFQPWAGVDVAGTIRGFAQSTFAGSFNNPAAIADGLVDAALVLVLGFWFMVDGRRMAQVAIQLFPPTQRDKARFVH